MKIAVLGATGLTGRQLVIQGLARGHHIVALARDGSRLADLASPLLIVATADVNQPASIAAAIAGVDVVVSGLGVSKGGDPATLTNGAAALVGSGAHRLVWLGALGTGRSRPLAGPLFGPLLSVILRSELAAKVDADTMVQSHGFTVVHAGRLTNKAATNQYRLIPVVDASPQWFPPSVARADVAFLMLDEAEDDHFAGQTVVVMPT